MPDEIKKLPIVPQGEAKEQDEHSADHGEISSTDTQEDFDNAVAEKQQRPAKSD